jgi:large subunit ribosomal protein L4
VQRQNQKDSLAAVAKSPGGKRARAEPAPAAFARRSGSAAEPPSVPSHAIIPTACRAPRGALLSALSLKNREGKIIVVDKFELEEAKTKLMVQALGELKVQSAVIVISEPNTKIERSARNLPKVKVLRVAGINVYDLLRYDHLILTQDALRGLEERLAA